MKKTHLVALSIAILAIVGVTNPMSTAAAGVDQSIELAAGWNIVSTPKVLESHTFSAPETAENFDVYVLDAASPSGWSTMASLDQAEFTPLFGYFIHNKTGVEQTLTFTYETTLQPNEKFFERSFPTTGWYSIGVANDEYAKDQNADRTDTDNPSNILSLLAGDYDLALDFTDAQYDVDRMSVALEDPWKAALPNDINGLNDFRETKGYAVYIKEADAQYSGFQNDAVDEPVVAALDIIASPNNPPASFIELRDDEVSDPLTVFAFSLATEASTEDISLTGTTINAVATTDLSNYVASAVLLLNGVELATTNSVDVDTITFDFDAVLLEAGETADLELQIVFQPLDAIELGHTLAFSVTTSGIEATANSDVMLTGSASGEEHTLLFDVPVVSDTQFTVDRNEAATAGTISFEFTLEADNGDYEFEFGDVEDVQPTGDDITYAVTGPSADYTVFVTKISGDTSPIGNGTRGWIINEGDQATFIADFNFANTSTAGAYRVNIDTIAGVEVDETSGALILTD